MQRNPLVNCFAQLDVWCLLLFSSDDFDIGRSHYTTNTELWCLEFISSWLSRNHSSRHGQLVQLAQVFLTVMHMLFHHFTLSSPHPLAVRFCVLFNTFVPRYRSHGFRVFPHLPFVSQRAYLSTVPPSVYIVHSQSFSLFYVKDALRRSYYSNFLPFLNIIYV